ncbi:Cullin-2 [Boothiomyces macroporosus]|uniref:Cullin-2 n=1 Tax=Boothiomyces macroporosus TaxID=261099 RepID=A0AAD5ULF0_9FUNG|nr:Cullin-2 [Boothiomyces macroporosus]
MNFYDKKYELSLSLRQLMIILPYNRAEEYTIEELSNITNFKPGDVEKILKSFIDFEILLQDNAIFKINHNFTNKRVKLKLPAIAIADSKEEASEAKKAVEEDRRYFIQAVIVRVMKAHQQMSHLALVDEVIRTSSSRFNPSIPLIKKCIEGLIEKQFIQRTEEKDQYAYIN